MDGIDVVASQQFTEIDVSCTVLGGVLSIHAILRVIPPLPSDIADRHVLHVRAAEEGILVTGTHVADADAPHHDSITRRWSRPVAERLRRDHIGRRHDASCSRGRLPEEIAAAGLGC